MEVHADIAKDSRTYYSRIMLAMLVLSPLVGCTPLLEFIPVYGHYISIALPVCVGIPLAMMTAFLKFSKYEQTISKNDKIVTDYRSLITEIQFQLDREGVDRKNRVGFFSWVETEYSRLMKLLPTYAPVLIEDGTRDIESEPMVLVKKTAISDYQLKRYASRFDV
jgi:hypothetical protein